MKVVALLAVRNEERYLERCLEHLYRQEIETCLIDNGSTDRTLEIARSFLDRGVVRIEYLPFTGVFELGAQLLCKERLAAEIQADWFIHYDADEIRQAPKPYTTLREGIEAVDRSGYNAIDFDEFVFLPTTDEESFEGHDYVEEMRYYYYFEPDSPDRYRINAWKKHPEVDLHTFAGHKVVFPGLKVSPDPFILRHYIVLSRAHVIEKYTKRGFSASEMAKSWHGDRASFRVDEFSFPAKDRLKKLDAVGDFDKSEPWKSHPLFSRAVSPKDTREQRQRIAVLKKFKSDHREYIPTIAPVSDRVERPFWSVMIPTFNANKKYLVEALESVLVQDPGPTHMQIEVVDDGTTAFDLEAVVKEVGKGRVAFYRQPQNLGLAANWNTCIQRAQGLWIHLLHQDDKVRTGFYEHLRGPCEQDQRIAAAFCRSAGIGETGSIKWMQEVERETPGILANFVTREAATNRIVSPSIVIRRAVYEDIGGYHIGMPYCTDWDMYKRVAVYGLVWYEPQCLAYWRQHAASATARLKSGGDDLVDRRKSIELSKAYLPSNVEVTSSNTALKTSLIWATDILRESLVQDNFFTALAQAREILRTLQQLTDAHQNIEGQSTTHSHFLPEDSVRLQAQVDWLEAQVQAWIRTAEAIRAKHQQMLQQRGR
jgi:glycosyltransferase involved in cell wall biosynthesis